jgi:hypothetical protein
MTVAGIYDVGLRDIEKRTIYISRKRRRSFRPDRAVYRSEHLAQAVGQEPAVMNELKPGLNGYEMTSWETNFPKWRLLSMPRAA